MELSISSDLISVFMLGLFAVFALMSVGSLLFLILRGLAKRFLFTRLAIALALAPISLAAFLELDGLTLLYLFSMIAVLLGLTIDGISYLLEPITQPRGRNQNGSEKADSTQDSASDPNGIAWEKAE